MDWTTGRRIKKNTHRPWFTRYEAGILEDKNMAGWKTQVYVSKTGSLETTRQEEEETSRSGVGTDEGDDNIQVKPTPTQNAIDNDSKDTETQKNPFQRPLIKKKLEKAGCWTV